jgi:HK97 family phage major capsid protein
MIQFLDRQFVDPAVAEVTNVSPASITNGVSSTTPTGADSAAFRTDIGTLLNTFLSNNLSMGSAFWIMTQQQAARISLMNNTFSSPIYPTVTPTGGTLLGFPVIASENLASTTGSPADGYPIILAAGDEIMLADDGVTMIDASNQASVQVDSAPDSPPTASTAYVSLWQTNSTALRAERWINWKKRRSTAVAYLAGAKYA